MTILDQIESMPNPQFARPSTIDLCGDWAFGFDDADVGLSERWYDDTAKLDRTIVVPFPPESEMSGIHETGFHPVIWYSRTFEDPRSGDGERLLMRFGAVDYDCTVWVDGAMVGTHSGGSTPFTFDVSDALVDGETHTVVLRAHDEPDDQEQPRGKQAWTPDPEIIHYYRTSGIWQPVSLEIAPKVRIEDLHWSFDAASRMALCNVALTEPAAPGTTLSMELELDGEPFVSGTWSLHGREYQCTFDLRHGNKHEDWWKLWWSPRNPKLIGTRCTISAPDQPDDVVIGYTGFREISTEGGKLQINREPVFMRLVLNQGYWHESCLAAPSNDAIKRDVELILALGFNGARNHQKAEDPRFMYWADRLGLLVWGEIGNAFAYSDRAIRRHSDEWRDLVVRDRNHPSVVAWVPFNESWGIEDVGLNENQQAAVKAAYWATHQLDGSRPVVGNDGWENVIGDLFTLHDYNWSGDVLTDRYGSERSNDTAYEKYTMGFRRAWVGDFEPGDLPFVLSEYGGVSFAPDAGEDWFGYGKVETEEEFIEKYRELTSAMLNSTWLTGFCYTQFTDTEQEINGLLRADRSPKVPMETISKITRGED